jgi:peptidoglycan/LPS O-acetylase OafA/YrhL
VLVALLGVPVALFVAAGVYLHATRRGLSRAASLRWAAGVGGVSFGGFLLADTFGDALSLFYLQEVKPNPVVGNPLEAIALRIAVGTGLSALGVLGYAVVSRDPA